MKNSDYQRILQDDIFTPIMAITEKKSHDYACDQDTLMNFKRVGQRLGIKASDVCWFFIAVKIERLGNLRGKDPKCESVLDTMHDLINYVGLYHACQLEENETA